MKTTTFSIIMCLALLAPTATVQAGLPTQSLFLLGAVAPGQAASSQQEADALLASARKAMNEGQYELADSFVNRAEKLNPQYGALHFGDTPQKLRAELSKKQTSPSTQATPALPSAPMQPNLLAASPTAPQLLPTSNSPLLPSANSQPYGANTAQTGYVSNPNDSSRLRQPGISPPGGFGVKYDNMVIPAGASETIPPAQSTLSIAGVSSSAPSLPTTSPTVPSAPALPTAPATSSSLYNSPANIGQANAAPKTLPPSGNSPQPTSIAHNPSSPYPYAPNQAGQAAPTQSPYGSSSGVAPAQVITPANNNPFAQSNTLPTPSRASEYLQKGEAALQAGQVDEAAKLFNLARDNQSDLDQAGRDRLTNHLQLLSRNQGGRTPPAGLLDSASTTQTLIAKQVSSEVSKIQTQAKEMRTTNPRKALEMLEQAKTTYTSAAGIDPAIREQIQRRLDLSIGEVKKYISENASQIALDESNKAVRDDVEASKQKRLDTDEKIKSMIKEFNELNKEHRYEEAIVLAKKLRELAPENPIVDQVWHNVTMLKRIRTNSQIAEAKEEGFNYAMTDVDRTSIPTTGDYVHGNAKDWENLTKTRIRRNAEATNRRSPREREIAQRMETPIQAKFVNRPLREVLELLSKVTDIPIVLDPQGLAVESISAEQPVTLNLERDIPLRSALRIMLPQFKLNYVIKDDVLKVTSEMLTRGNIYPVTYAVADLVIPIPNFAPTGQEGLVGAMTEGYRQANMWRAAGAAGWRAGGTGLATVQVAATGQETNLDQNPEHLAQQNRFGNLGNTGFNGYNGGSNMGPQIGTPQPISFGPNGMGGGGAQPDFESLINLIQTTVQPKTWKDVSGDDNGGTIDRYQTNLSLVVRNTQEVHEELADLLQQLRRLQDLQVTIEVRFVTLSDNFFERIGIDFDFSIDDNVTSAGLNTDTGPSSVIGLGPDGNPTPALNLQFNQGSFGAGTVPTLPGIGFDPATAGTFGFAILSDIEAFFLINAAQGDSRSNILQAPKVTLFNGQTAFVSDFTQRPFVASVIPVVGDFAIGQQPVIVVLGEGTTLTVQAVVSNDRRFVRLTVVPFFSQIDDVEEFTFVGSKTSTTKDSDTKGADDAKSTDKEKTTFEEGVTIQRPTFSVVSVNTTVSVPDGGTVLLGGIKRLSEGRNERGIPILSKLPYINRLFKNVGIGRTTQSLMIMVTPRIIIQEEEEAKLTGTDPALNDTTNP